MNRLLNSKVVAWVALILVVILIIVTFKMRPVWWAFIDLFFAFMMVFCQLMGLYVKRFSIPSGKTLQTIAAVCGGLTVLSLIGEYIAFQCVQ